MTLVVGHAPDGADKGALDLAVVMARSAGEDLAVCVIVPSSWPPSLARVDAEYQVELDRAAQERLEQARARVPDDVAATYGVHHARSVPRGLLEVCDVHDAALVVVGSSSAGPFGHVALGSVTGRLLHSSPVPVALAPRGHRVRPDARVRRVTAAFGGTEGTDDLVVAAAGQAARVGAALRIASFAVRARPPYTSGVGRAPEQAIVQEWAQEVAAAGRAALEQVEDLPQTPREVEAVIGYGESWEEALEDVEWAHGDVLVVGSSAIGPVARVFLGSRASMIVRHSPVPVVVVPRGRAAELAERAVQGEAA